MLTFLLWVTEHSGHSSDSHDCYLPLTLTVTHTHTHTHLHQLHIQIGAWVTARPGHIVPPLSQKAQETQTACVVSRSAVDVSRRTLQSKTSHETHFTRESCAPINFYVTTFQIKITSIRVSLLESLIACQWFMCSSRFVHLKTPFELCWKEEIMSVTHWIPKNWIRHLGRWKTFDNTRWEIRFFRGGSGDYIFLLWLLQRQISEEVGCSPNTVYNQCKNTSCHFRHTCVSSLKQFVLLFNIILTRRIKI